MQKKIFKLLGPLLQKAWKYYSSKPRTYHFRDLTLEIPAGVFHPALFLSTKVLIRFLDKQIIEGKKIWELGAGSGLIAMLCAKRGAIVTATDINAQALIGITENCKKNQLLSLQIIHSDLFQSIEKQTFDIIMVNPPYYPKKPQNDAEQAFYCGENFEYFHRFFEGIGNYTAKDSKVYMILSDDCAIEEIKQIASQSHYQLQLVWQEKVWGEVNFIFEIIAF